MSNTYYDSQLTAAEIEAALEAIDNVIVPANNGKVLAVENGGIVAKDVSEYTDLPVLVSKNITANGNYDPASDDADGYSSVAVNVPNSYAAGDEGKVVSNGALVAQTARSSDITQNGTYDTTLNNEIVVDVQGGGSAVIEPLSVTQNGTYTAPSGVDGYSPVTVNVSGGGGECKETVSYYGWTYGGYSGFAVMERDDGAVFGKVAINHVNEVLTGNLISFSYYGDGTNNLTITALTDIQLTVYSATTSTTTSTALTGTTYQMTANETKTLTNPNYSGGLYIVAEAL